MILSRRRGGEERRGEARKIWEIELPSILCEHKSIKNFPTRADMTGTNIKLWGLVLHTSLVAIRTSI
jgi:hypothetical protein